MAAPPICEDNSRSDLGSNMPAQTSLIELLDWAVYHQLCEDAVVNICHNFLEHRMSVSNYESECFPMLAYIISCNHRSWGGGEKKKKKKKNKKKF